MAAQTLSPEQLLTRCDPASLTLTDAQAEADAPGIVGQPRAAAAVEYALATPHAGHHLFVAGPPGSGRRALVRQAVQQRLRDDGITRSDWVYVNRFDAPHKPLALELPAGRGTALRDDMKSLVRDLRTMIRTMFESEEYATEVERIDTEFKQRAEQAFIEVGHKAQRRGLAMVRTPVGFTVAPQKDGEVMPPPVFESLPEEQRAELQKAMAEVQEQLVRALRASMRLRKEHAERVREMNRSMTRVAAEHALEEIRERHADLPKVAAWLDAVAADVVEHADDFRAPADEDGNTSEAGEAGEDHGDLSRYEVNLLLDASAADGVGLVEADLPTVPNLVGRVDHIARFGMLLTDFRLIKGGLLHRANGGHLLIDAVQLLSQPYAWQTLKRALRRGEIRIEAVAEQLGLISTVQLEPEPIPLKLKVVLVGTREICALLQAYDDEFDQLFRVVADLGDDMPRDAANMRALAATLRSQARDAGLLPADAAALAACIDHGARLAEDSTRLSARVRFLLDVLHEADHLARRRGATAIERDDVRAAIAARRERAGRVNERLADAVRRGVLLIDTSGERVGQVNGLSVYEVGGEGFGAVIRISATTRLGHGEVIDVQRETHLGGPIHAKGVMILSAFLAARFSRQQPHSLVATLVFEQTYGLVEGDSASLAELAALLSSLADLPLKQGWALTGSVNQFGQAQAIGGVNEKIEGFFDVCAARGLDGTQGVLLPAANVEHLMLREDVVEAVRAGRFALRSVQSIDDVMECLTGAPAGAPEQLSDATVNGRIARRLRELARIRRGEPRALRRGATRTTPRAAGGSSGDNLG
ncbi:MAG: ATP-binding protein [Piscinibacter sp.]|uniref:Lon protease family protein n=1 Tax=Piscinibacter sp. TaxID=1903157 RepID=UPI0035B2D4CD